MGVSFSQSQTPTPDLQTSYPIFLYIFPPSDPKKKPKVHFLKLTLYTFTINFHQSNLSFSIPNLTMYKSPTVFHCFITIIIIINSFVLLSRGVSATKHEDIGIYELNNGHFSVKLTNWGATIVSVFLPDKNGTHS